MKATDIWKYQVGDIVTHVGMPDACEYSFLRDVAYCGSDNKHDATVKRNLTRFPQRLVIVRQFLEVGDGVFERSYRIHAIIPDGNGSWGCKLVERWITEEMLRPYPTVKDEEEEHATLDSPDSSDS